MLDHSMLLHDYPNAPLRILAECGGFYQCPKDKSGRRLGPLVGYAGTYKPEDKHFVGDIYVNIAAAEQFPEIMFHFARELHQKLKLVAANPCYCGAPEGGKSLANLLALLGSVRYCYPEKKVTKAASSAGREESDLVFSRHDIIPGEDVVIVEDVCNNFKTTGMLIRMIEEKGGRVVAIVCILNRSSDVTNAFEFEGKQYPVVALVQEPFPQYRQEDPEVAADIAAGNVVWKPKNEWDKLAAAMAEHGTAL